MQQSGILGDKPFSPGLSIVGSEGSRHVPTLGEECEYALDRPRGDDHVSIDKEEDVTLGVAGSMIPCRSRARVLRELEDTPALLRAMAGVVSVDASSTMIISTPGWDELRRAERHSRRDRGCYTPVR
jgi:hypothetical protein